MLTKIIILSKNLDFLAVQHPWRKELRVSTKDALIKPWFSLTERTLLGIISLAVR